MTILLAARRWGFGLLAGIPLALSLFPVGDPAAEAAPDPPVAPVVAPMTSAAPPDSTLILNLRKCLNENRWADAESLSFVMRRRAEARTPLDTLLFARALDQLVAARIGAGRIADPELTKTARQAIGLRERALGPEHTDLAISLIRLAELLNAQGDCAAAIPLAERGVRIREKVLGPETNAVARGMMILGMGLSQCGRLEEARQLYERSVAIREKVLGPDASEVAVSLNNLGSTLQNLGRLDEAQNILSRALTIRRQTLGPEHPYIATTLGNLGNISAQRGRYAEARRLQLEALAIREKGPGPRSMEAALSYLNLGALAFYTGRYDESIAWSEKALEAREFSLGPEHPDVALALDNFGGLMVRIGDYARAIDLLERGIAIHRKSTGAGPTQLAWGLMNLALARTGLGQHDEAAKLASECLDLVRHDRELAPLDRAQFEAGQAFILLRKGDLLSSRDQWRRALALREAALDPLHPDIARVCAELGDVERRLGHMVTADRLLRRALEIYRKIGDRLPGQPDAQQKRSLLLYQKGDRRGALALALDAQPRDREQLRAIARSLPERQALRFAATRAPGRDMILTVASEDTQSATVRAAWNDVMAYRSLVLDEMVGRLRLTHAPGAAGLDTLREELSEAGAWLSHLLTTEEAPDHPEGLGADVDRARARYDAAERALARASADYRRQADRPEAGLEALDAARPAHSAIVAFARYQRMPARSGLPEPGPAHYLAFVLPAGGSEPRAIPLGSAADIDRRVGAWRTEVARGALIRDRTEAEALAACRAAGLEVRRAVWDPLHAAIAGAERVFLVPEGPLHLVNFGALPTDDGGFLVEEPAILHVVTTERDLLPSASAPTGRGLLAIGGAAFDSLGLLTEDSDARVAGAVSDGAPSGPPPSAGLRGATNDCPRFRDLRFAPLAGSLLEIAAVTRDWNSSAPGRAGEPATRVIGRAASEETVKRRAAGHRVLHLATHGFYLESECRDGAQTAANTRGIGGLVPARPEPAGRRRVEAPPAPVSRPVEDLNPLHLSGVALAGANLRTEAGLEREDGILTAEELALLNLDGVEWAVLSACDSGVGSVGEGEGVFGLRRALQVAGARTVILALWAVRDDVTAIWMSALYEARFGRSLDTATACREASLRILATRRASGTSIHPFYWAGFLAAGGWR